MTSVSSVEIFGEPISVYTASQGVEDGYLVEVFKERWPELCGPDCQIVATIGVHSSFSMAALIEMWNAFVPWLKSHTAEDLPFVTNMNGEAVWINHDGAGVFTIYFPHED